MQLLTAPAALTTILTTATPAQDWEATGPEQFVRAADPGLDEDDDPFLGFTPTRNT